MLARKQNVAGEGVCSSFFNIHIFLVLNNTIYGLFDTIAGELNKVLISLYTCILIIINPTHIHA